MSSKLFSILVVEDDSYACDTLVSLLQSHCPDAVVHSAGNGSSALEMFHAEPADLVITDIAMPGLDGIALATELKRASSEVTVIATTAYTDTADLLKAIEIGIDHYLVKPLRLDKLFPLITRARAHKSEAMQRRQAQEALRLSEEKHQQELRLLNEQLECRVKERTAELEAAMRDLESFSYSVSHDLRAPLRHINCFSAMIAEDFGDCLPPEGHRYLDTICEASVRMGALIDHLLDLSRVMRAELRPEPVDLSRMAEQVLDMLRETEPGREVELVLEQGIEVSGDPWLLRQLLENLLGNAWKYTAKKAHARIEFGRCMVAGQDTVFVKDNGAGFDMAYQNNLFSVFQRLHTDFEGMGIGLATADRIVQRHGGRIWAEAKVDEGATFYFTLTGKSAAWPQRRGTREFCASGRGEVTASAA